MDLQQCKHVCAAERQGICKHTHTHTHTFTATHCYTNTHACTTRPLQKMPHTHSHTQMLFHTHKEDTRTNSMPLCRTHTHALHCMCVDVCGSRAAVWQCTCVCEIVQSARLRNTMYMCMFTTIGVANGGLLHRAAYTRFKRVWQDCTNPCVARAQPTHG